MRKMMAKPQWSPKREQAPYEKARCEMRRQYRREQLNKGADVKKRAEPSSIGAVFRRIMMRVTAYYGRMRDTSVEDMVKLDEKVMGAEGFQELEAIYPMAEDVADAIKLLNETILEFVDGEFSESPRGNSTDFLISVSEYTDYVLYGLDYSDLRQNIWPWIKASGISDALVFRVFQKMHLAWLEKNLNKRADFGFAPFWGHFVGFHVAGTKALEQYAAILVPILQDLGMEEAETSMTLLKWYKEYRAELKRFLSENQYNTREKLEHAIEYAPAKLLDGLPGWLREQLRDHYVSDDGRCAAAVVANIRCDAEMWL